MDVLIGLDYEALETDEKLGKGHFSIVRRGISMTEIVEELRGYIENGHYFPAFPPEANPEIVYAYDLNEQEDADIYGIVVNALNESLKRRKNGHHH